MWMSPPAAPRFWRDKVSGHMKSREARLHRQQEAAERAAEREQRGDVGQLNRLEKLGFGECREAARLRKKLGMTEPGALSEPLVKENA